MANIRTKTQSDAASTKALLDRYQFARSGHPNGAVSLAKIVWAKMAQGFLKSKSFRLRRELTLHSVEIHHPLDFGGHRLR